MNLHLSPFNAILVCLLASLGLIAGAWWFELHVGLLPCKLCLEQRQPHYAAIGLAGCAVFLRAGLRKTESRLMHWFGAGALLLLAAIYLWSAGLGAYHSGVEWGWFVGPNDCGGAPANPAASMQDFMKQLNSVRVVSCMEAAWRLMGLSLAGWNALASLALIGVALAGFRSAMMQHRA
jgi:disulfide bond formation protein DsbB